jgi:hypothetical protein
MKPLFCFLLAGSAFGATWTIDAGSSKFGTVSYTQSGAVTVTTSGNPASALRGYAYFDLFGGLNISLPPGVSGTCSGAPCDIYTTDSTKGATQYGGSSARPANASDALYWIDPVFNTTTSTSGATSLLANAPAPLAGAGDGFDAGAGETAGLRFQSTATGFLVQARVYKQAQDTSTSVTAKLSDDSGALLGTVTISYSSGATGWQTATFTPAIALTANTFYQIWLTTGANGGYAYRNGFFANYRMRNGVLRSAATYQGSSSCDPGGNWPQTADGYSGGATTLPSAGIIGCASYGVTGTVSLTSPNFGGGAGNLGWTRWAANPEEGSQVMRGGHGPGPYALINTVIDNSGNQWHHDNDGGYRNKTDYWYYRNVFQWQPAYRTGATGSDGFNYISRQLLEWKAGFRIRLEGNIFQYAWNDGQGSALTIVVGNKDAGAHDIWIGNNEFRNGPGVMQGFSQYEEGPPPARDYFGNNLIWGQGSYGSIAQEAPGRGWLLEGAGAFEDARIEHNTVQPTYGQYPAFWWVFQRNNPEGVSITDNILPVDSGTSGIQQEGGWCVGVPSGEATMLNASCGNFRSLTFSRNLLYPTAYSVSDTVNPTGPYTFTSNQTQGGIQAKYPTTWTANYLPASTVPGSYGWFQAQAYPANVNSLHPGPVDARVRSGSLLSPSNAAGYRATDGGNIGADMQAIRDAEGVVELVGVPVNLLSAVGASIVFNAPDRQSCPVDYKVFDASDPTTTNGFTRVTDSGTGRTRSVAITGLTTKTAYQYVIRCAAWQPGGVFLTK